MELNPSPCFSVSDFTDLVLPDSKFYTNFSLSKFSSFVHLSNINDFFWSKFCHWGNNPSPTLEWSFRMWKPSFSGSILHVFLMRPNPKVIWIAASPIIARMTHAFSFWNLTIFNKISGSMAKHLFSIQRRFCISSLFVHAFNPQPAIIRGKNINTTPKSFLEWRFFFPFRFCPKFSHIHITFMRSHKQNLHCFYGFVNRKLPTWL